LSPENCLQAVEKLLEDSTQLQKSSVLGIVLRRVFLQFDKLSFRQPTEEQALEAFDRGV
jgi:hypothetical protein